MSIPGETAGTTSRNIGQELDVVATRERIDEVESACSQALEDGRDVLVVCPEEHLDALPAVTERDEVTVVGTPSGREQFDLDRLAAEESPRSRRVLVAPAAPVDVEDESDTEEAETDTEHTLVAVPAYNEEATVGEVADAALERAGEVVVIDDGSDDGTVREAWRAQADVVAHARNEGYGSALQTAFEVADERNADHLVIMDGDGQHDPADIPGLVEALETREASVVVGSRFVGESTGDIPLYRRFGLLVINVLTNLSLGNFSRESWIRDTQCGFRAFDRDAIEYLSSESAIGDDMGASLDILYRLSERGETVEEYPVVVDYDVPSGSSQNPVTHGLGLVVTILRTTLRKHPAPVVVVSVLLLAVLFGALYLGVGGF